MNISLTRPDGVKAVSVTIDCGDHKMTALVLSPEGGAEAAADRGGAEPDIRRPGGG